MISDNCIDTIKDGNSHHAPTLSWGEWLSEGKRLVAKEAHKTFTVLLEWQRRMAARYMMIEMEERILRDIGITREDVLKEAQKPFWKP